MKARLFETHRREYENFTQEPGESIDLMSWCCNHSRVAEGTRPSPEGVYSGGS